MKNNSYLNLKKMKFEKISSFEIKNFVFDFKFKYYDFYSKIYYLRKNKKFDLILERLNNYISIDLKKKNFSLFYLLMIMK